MRELVGEYESDNLVTYRCDGCAKCVMCMKSPRLTFISLQESLEQSFRNVLLCIIKKQVIAALPFVKDPVDFLTKKHGDDKNKGIYLSQCKKGNLKKEGMKKAHNELAENGFMTKLQDLPRETQNMI